MKISWQWLRELLSLDQIHLDLLINKLTLAGFEIEQIENIKDSDKMLEISSTANRLDINNIAGITKELSSLLSIKMKFCYTQKNLKIYHKNLNNNSTYEKIIYGFAEGIDIKESPQWLQNKLKLYNIKSYNNIIDIINFIYIKWSQKINILYNNDINCEQYPSIDTNFGTLNKNLNYYKIYKIENCNQTTLKKIIIKTEILDKQYTKLKNKASTIDNKDIKSINHTNILNAYNEAITLIYYLCNTKVKKMYLLSKKQKEYKPISINYINIKKILGPQKSKNYIAIHPIKKILNDLYFLIYTNKNQEYIEIPEYRVNDIYREIDIIEEISRIYGFNNFLDKVPTNYKRNYNYKKTTKYRVEQIKSILRSLGLNETIHYSIDDTSKKSLNIYNPLTLEHKNLRNNLLKNLINIYKSNKQSNQSNCNIFEIGRIFRNKDNSYIESHHISGIIGGQKYLRQEWTKAPNHLSWFQAKGEIEELFTRLNIIITWNKPNLDYETYNTVKDYLHPKYTGIIYVKESPIGVFGQLRNTESTKNDFNAIYGFEIELKPIISTELISATFADYSKYPSVIRDISINIPKHISFQYIYNIIKNINNPIIESIELFDFYSYTSNINKIGLRVIYRGYNSTLTTSIVDQIELKIKQYINKNIQNDQFNNL
uniref:phenylalanine--tRNA ligase n=1 Tax=Galaxaura rugosa TaxID=268570 RepID=A0A1G4NT64_9FLOR|nr:Phenylalanine-tRNA ligase beta subunit [Galaxaura rugosa]SCW21850.1 Phenylalanine-tRNA ligase beta subunit [Galaxaura rugosa]